MKLTTRGTALALILMATAFAPARPAAQEVATTQPNILIVITDDQRAAGTMRVLDDTRRWFQSGTTFTHAYATTPTCCPSRASVFTGRYAHNHGVKTSEAGQAELLDQTTTMQNVLQTAGYRNAMFGKFLNSWDVNTPPPYFDSWASYSGSTSHYYRDGYWNVDGSVQRVHRYSTSFISDRAVSFLEAAETNDEQPWFLYVAPTAPHAPYEVQHGYEQARVGHYRPTPATEETDLSDKPPYLADAHTRRGKMEELRSAQLRTLLSVDDMVDRVFAQLEASGELENTLAFFLSDNGYLWGEHGSVGKRLPYTDSVGIPLRIMWPGHFSSGTRDDRLVATIDLAPTILEAAGLPGAETMDGHSLLDSSFSRDRILLEHWLRAKRTTPDWASFYSLDSQYVEYYLTDRFVVEFREYYDLTTDPYELLNMLGDDDMSNDPDTTALSLDLAKAVRCQGTTGLDPCP